MIMRLRVLSAPRRSRPRPARSGARRATAPVCPSRGSTRRSAPSRSGRSRAGVAITSGVSSGRFSSSARRSIRSVATLSGQVEEEDRVERAADLAQHAVEGVRLGRVAGEPVEHEPGSCVGLAEPLADQRDRQRRREPARHLRGSAAPACRARSGRRWLARNMSPVETCGTSYSAAIRFACVPFPAP